MKMNYPVLHGLDHDDLMDAYGPMLAFPTSALISTRRQDLQEAHRVGPKESLEKEIKALL